MKHDTQAVAKTRRFRSKRRTMALMGFAGPLVIVGVGFAYPAMVQSRAGHAPISPLLEPVYNCESARLHGPENPTESEIAAALTAWWSGESLPTEWTFDDSTGRVSAKMTGVVTSSGEIQLLVNVADDPEDMQQAYVYLDSELIVTASRANGMIIERGGAAYATMTILVPPFYPHTVEVAWEDSAGNSNRHVVEASS